MNSLLHLHMLKRSRDPFITSSDLAWLTLALATPFASIYMSTIVVDKVTTMFYWRFKQVALSYGRPWLAYQVMAA